MGAQFSKPFWRTIFFQIALHCNKLTKWQFSDLILTQTAVEISFSHFLLFQSYLDHVFIEYNSTVNVSAALIVWERLINKTDEVYCLMRMQIPLIYYLADQCFRMQG